MKNKAFCGLCVGVLFLVITGCSQQTDVGYGIKYTNVSNANFHHSTYTVTDYNKFMQNEYDVKHYPALFKTFPNLKIRNINGAFVNSNKGQFEMSVQAYVPQNKNQVVNLDMYHKLKGNIRVGNEQLKTIKDKVNLLGVVASYTEFNNRKFGNDKYIIWDSGDWLFVLNSNLPKSRVLQFAKGIEKQVEN
jgi:hypothetical protein